MTFVTFSTVAQMSSGGDSGSPAHARVTRGEKFSVIRETAVALVLGIAHGCGANAPQWALLQLLALAAMLTVLFLANSKQKIALSALAALVFSVASAAAAHSWIWAVLAADDALAPALGTLIFAALVVGIALLPAAALAISAALVIQPSRARLAPFALAASYPLAEIGTDALLGFSWHSISYSTTGTPLTNLLPYVGARGVAAAVMFVCAWIALWTVDSLRAHRFVAWAGAGVLSAVVIALAVAGRTNYIPGTRPVAQPLHARLVQPAMEIRRKFDAGQQRDTVRHLLLLAEDPGAHLIVTPETVLPRSWATLPTDLREPLMSLVDGSDRTLLIGLFDRREDGGLLNVSVPVRADSRLAPPRRYAKRHLVPVAERVTPGLAWISDALALPFAQRATVSGDPVMFETPHANLQTTLCLDLAHGGDLAATAGSATVIVNQSNLAAFPGERVRQQFLAIARVRAIEQGKPLLLATNDGPTAFIDAHGVVLAELAPFAPGAMTYDVRPRRGRTPFAVLGEAGWLVLLALGALACAVWPRRDAGVKLP
jgi:apolipoprotein N-acyltransferase